MVASKEQLRKAAPLGGRARALKLSKARRKEIARLGGLARQKRRRLYKALSSPNKSTNTVAGLKPDPDQKKKIHLKFY